MSRPTTSPDAASGDGASALNQNFDLRSYAVVTAGYWVFTVTDGALRMLVLLHFHDLGYSAVSIALLFLAYEFMGVLTNLIGGWVGARVGLQRILVAGLALQAFSLAALTLQQPGWPRWWSVAFVMGVQALSGVAKDLTKMSAKSTVKSVAGTGSLFRLVAVLTGSKNALKGVGFFVGAALLAAFGYDPSLLLMAATVAATAAAVAVNLRRPLGAALRKPAFRSLLSTSPAINWLSAARLFLFGARDIWFVVAVPVFLAAQLGWSDTGVGAFMALWVIGYGIVQSAVPSVVGRRDLDPVRTEQRWVVLLLVVTVALAMLVAVPSLGEHQLAVVVVAGLIVFGVVFAINSSLHSYLIIAFARSDATSIDVGFYYSANAVGRLIGTLLSGVLYTFGGLDASLWGSAGFVAASAVLTLRLPTLSTRAR